MDMFQMIEQDKTSEKDFNETEITNLPYKKFKVTIIKIFTNFRETHRMNTLRTSTKR